MDVDVEDGHHEDDGTEEAGANAGRPSWSAATRWLIVRPCGLRFFSFGWPLALLLLLLLLVEPRAEALRGRMLALLVNAGLTPELELHARCRQRPAAAPVGGMHGPEAAATEDDGSAPAVGGTAPTANRVAEAAETLPKQRPRWRHNPGAPGSVFDCGGEEGKVDAGSTRRTS